jgi:hypothetical protein
MSVAVVVSIGVEFLVACYSLFCALRLISSADVLQLMCWITPILQIGCTAVGQLNRTLTFSSTVLSHFFRIFTSHRRSKCPSWSAPRCSNCQGAPTTVLGHLYSRGRQWVARSWM